MRKNHFLIIFFVICTLFSCVQTEQVPRVESNVAFVHFTNRCSYTVELYRNINPSASDTSTKPIAKIPSGKTEKLALPPSQDQMVGDVFYIHYLIRIDDGLTFGGKPVYVKAKQDVFNLTFVLNKNKTYDKIIVQPKEGQLKFAHGYIKVKNTGAAAFQVVQGTTVLENLSTKEINISGGKTGIYQIDFSGVDEERKIISALKFRFTAPLKDVAVPEFTIEQGQIVTFECDGDKTTMSASMPISY